MRFFRATLCQRGICCRHTVCLSVCLSHADSVSKRLNVKGHVDNATRQARDCSFLALNSLRNSNKVTHSHYDSCLNISYAIGHIFSKYKCFNKKHLKNVGLIRHCEPPHAALPFTRCRYCRTPPAHRCPQQRRRRQQQRQRVTEGIAMAPQNGPNNRNDVQGHIRSSKHHSIESMRVPMFTANFATFRRYSEILVENRLFQRTIHLHLSRQNFC